MTLKFQIADTEVEAGAVVFDAKADAVVQVIVKDKSFYQHCLVVTSDRIRGDADRFRSELFLSEAAALRYREKVLGEAIKKHQQNLSKAKARMAKVRARLEKVTT
jgi:hypothetical protein